MADTGLPNHVPPLAGALGDALLKVLLARSPADLHVLDEHLRVLRSDTAGTTEQVAGAFLGQRFSDVYRLDEPQAAELLLREVLSNGRSLSERAFRGHRADHPGQGRRFLLSAHRLNDSRGRSLGRVLASVADVTEGEKARRRKAALAAVREAVGRTLDVTATSEAFVAAVVPGFADIAVVDVLDDVLRGTVPLAGPAVSDVPLRRAAFRGREGCAVPVHPLGGVRRLPDLTPYGRVLSDFEPRLVTLGPDTPWLKSDPDLARAIRTSGAASVIVAPLSVGGAPLGLVSLYRCDESEPYEEADRKLVLSLTAHTALSLDNARRFEYDHALASTVQRRLLPPRTTAGAAIETAHLLLAGHSSGCWFDTIGLSGARTALVAGGVNGQGIQTAAAMGQLRTVINALADLDLEPDELLARLNNTANRLARERAALPPGDPLHRQPLTATCVYGVYDPFTRTCTVACAGHPPPLVVHPDGSTSTPDVVEGPELGSFDTAPCAVAAVTLEEGSLLAFFTGALRRDGELAGPAREALAQPGRPLQELCDAVVYTLAEDDGAEGVALLLARTGSVLEGQVAELELPHDPTAPALARNFARELLSAWALEDDTAYGAELIVSELVTNAVRYGTPPLRLRLIRGETLTCEVHDTSALAPHLRHARTADEGGRGLFIVSQLADQWGTRYAEGGKVLWTEQPLEPSDRS
ncbi:SpoIIE family protein phosphatase [Streptomyces peucetius]|uniref:SpoIIE family protein phosphatase n=1 Tax=Streptomyces peucetius TaxID=1950 RepID=A0ABY6IDW1_STRPE|nr:SpoIIE family protein phosphatase [Streptomyces peucetius]UYQ65163.1 SpoIIE family protein phosphatase [Streptomyces peucetius]